MSLGEILIGAVAAAVGIRGLMILPRVWRNEWYGPHPDRPFSGWPFGIALWRGFVRSGPLGAVFAIFAALVWFLGKGSSDPALDTVADVLAVITFFILFPIGGAVTLFNRPKWVVVPYLRHQPGAIAEWRGASVEPSAKQKYYGQTVWSRRKQKAPDAAGEPRR